jgi:hypothetical protein
MNISTLTTKVISNEFDQSPNLVKVQVQNHRNGNVCYNLNKAEVIAIKEEEMRLEEERRKKESLIQGEKAIKENLRSYYQKIREQEELNMKKKNDLLMKKQSINDYNKTLREKAMKKKSQSLNIKVEEPKKAENITNDKRIFETFSFNDGVQQDQNFKENKDEEQNSIPTFTHRIDNEFTNIIDIRGNIDALIKQKLAKQQDNYNPFENNLQTNKNHANKEIIEDRCENKINDEVIKNIEYIKQFRKSGLINHAQISRNEELHNNYSNRETEQKTDFQNTNKNYLKKKKELDKRR